MPKPPHWGWHSAHFQSQLFKACLYHCEIQEMLHLRNWCLCRWNSSIVTISAKWQQCSPDHCLRDDILLNSISFLIIFSCSIYHLSLFTVMHFFALLPFSLLKIYSSLRICPFLFSHFTPHVILFHVIMFPLWDVPSICAIVKRGSSDTLCSVIAWCHHQYCIRWAFYIHITYCILYECVVSWLLGLVESTKAGHFFGKWLLRPSNKLCMSSNDIFMT